MTMWLEQQLDRLLPVPEGEPALTEEGRERLYQHSSGAYIAVPDLPIYRISNPGGRPNTSVYYVEGYAQRHNVPRTSWLDEADISAGLQAVDTKILGPAGRRYDHVFNELRWPGATARFNRIHRDANRLRAGIFAGGVIAAAVVSGLKHLPPPLARHR